MAATPIIECDRWISSQLRAHLAHHDPHRGEPYWSYDLGEVLSRLEDAGQTEALLVFENACYRITFEPAPIPDIQPKGPFDG